MAPKKRSPNFNTHARSQQQHRPGEVDPTPEQPEQAEQSPSQPKAKRRRQPRNSGPGISPEQSSTQGNVDPSLSSLPVANSPHQSSEDENVPESSSRRQSTSSTMRTSSIPMEGQSSQTPTGRISKAKKGKRVHACSFEGCGKVSQTALSFPQLRTCANLIYGTDFVTRSSPEPSIDDDMNSTTTLKQCSLAIVLAVARLFTV